MRLSTLLIIFALLFSINNTSADSLSYSLDHHSYAGPMAVFQLANDWRGDIKSGKDAFSFIQHGITAKKGAFSLSVLSRTYHEFKIGNNLARGFYYYNNNISLDEPLKINSSLQAKIYSGRGIRMAYEFQLPTLKQVSIRLKPSLVALRLDNIIWGGLEGNLFYSDTKNWGGTVDLDYSYTKDRIVRRKLTGDYVGQLYSLDLSADLTSPYLNAEYQGTNLYGRIYWDGLPRTTAQVSTETAFALLGYEYFDDVILNPPALHFIAANGPISNLNDNAKVSWVIDAQVTPIKTFYFHGFRLNKEIEIWGNTDNLQLSLQYDFTHSTPKVSLEYGSFKAILASQTLDVSRSQQIITSVSLGYKF